MCQNGIYYSVGVFIFYIYQNYASQNSGVSGVSLMPSLHLKISHKVLSSSQTFCHNESMPSSSGAGGVFAVLGTTHTFRAADPFQKFLFQKFLSEFSKRVDVWISILTTTTITTTTKIKTNSNK